MGEKRQSGWVVKEDSVWIKLGASGKKEGEMLVLHPGDKLPCDNGNVVTWEKLRVGC